MTSEGNLTQWIDSLKEGDPEAAEVIWEQYFDKLVALARKRLKGMPPRAVDEEDVALSALNSFYEGATAGRFPQLADRDDLWKLLVTITARKALAQQKRHRARKRGGGNVRGESMFHGSEESEAGGIVQLLSEEPTPELIAEMSETCRRLLDQLDDEVLKRISLYKMEGYSNEEIAEVLDCSVRTVERKLERIRRKWSDLGS